MVNLTASVFAVAQGWKLFPINSLSVLQQHIKTSWNISAKILRPERTNKSSSLTSGIKEVT